MKKGSSLPDVYRDAWFYCKDGHENIPQPFAIITAYNPDGKFPAKDHETSTRLNEQKNLKLRDEIYLLLQTLHGLEGNFASKRVFEVVGCSKDQRHQEPSWAASIPLALAVSLGQKYRQDAIFCVKEDVLYLASCKLGTKGEPVADWRLRQLSAI